jgi:hypothetical protein
MHFFTPRVKLVAGAGVALASLTGINYLALIGRQEHKLRNQKLEDKYKEAGIPFKKVPTYYGKSPIPLYEIVPLDNVEDSKPAVTQGPK